MKFSHMLIVSPLATWLRPEEIGLMGRPCTHESLGWKQGKPGGLVVQTLGAKCGDRGRAKRAPCAHCERARRAPRAHRGWARHASRAHHGRARRAPWASQTRIVRAPWRHLGYGVGAEGYFGDLNYFVFI